MKLYLLILLLSNVLYMTALEEDAKKFVQILLAQKNHLRENLSFGYMKELYDNLEYHLSDGYQDEFKRVLPLDARERRALRNIAASLGNKIQQKVVEFYDERDDLGKAVHNLHISSLFYLCALGFFRNPQIRESRAPFEKLIALLDQ